MITRFKAENYGCLKQVEVALTPLHAFIGPNDSGKSTLLRGLRTVVQLANEGFIGWPRDPRPFDPTLSFHADNESALSCTVDGGTYWVRTKANRPEDGVSLDDGNSLQRTRYIGQQSDVLKSRQFAPVLERIGHARMLRLDPDALRAPSGLIPEGSTAGFLDDRGRGLPGVYFTVRNYDEHAFAGIVETARQYFPTLKTLRLKPVTNSTLELEAELTDGTRVRAEHLSEGLLYFLAILALPYLSPVSLLLVEEPENGLHPARVAEVVRLLRAMVETTGTQVIIATHSPLVINELRPEEVTVVTRPSLEQGSQCTPIRETHNFAERNGVYALGELWLAYSDGEQETPLFDARRR